MKKALFTLLALGLGLYATHSSAQIFKIHVTNYGGLAGNQTFVDFVDAQMKVVEDEINKDLPNAAPDRLMQGMANSSVMAAKGVGADYASNMQVFLIGATVGAGADLEKNKDEQSETPVSGAGIASGVVFGKNLGFMDTAKILGMDTNRLNIYFNFMGAGYDYIISKDPGKESDAKIGATTLGFRIRYDWIKGAGSKWLGWGGIKFHTGYQYNHTNITFHSKINQTVNQSSGTGEVISGTITGDPDVNVLVNTHSIPVELSTDVQFLYILSLYGGMGADFNFGSAKGKGDLNASDSVISCTGGVCPGGTTIGVKPEGNINTTGKVNPFLFRGFAGVQINLPFLRIYAQVNKALGNQLIGANVGVNFVY